MEKEMSYSNPSTTSTTEKNFRQKVKDRWKEFTKRRVPDESSASAGATCYMQSYSLSRGLRRLLIVGLLMVIILQLNPDFAEKFPVLSDVSEGIIALYEWGCKTLIGFFRLILSPFTADSAGQLFRSMWNDSVGLLHQFWNWIQSIPF